METENRYRELKDMDIEKDIIEPINNKTVKTKELAIQLNLTEKALKSHIKDNGYVWKGSTYKKAIEKPIEVKTVSEKVKVTYRIDKELQRLVKLQSIIEDTDNSTIIERAIEKYVSKEAHSINEQIKKKK